MMKKIQAILRKGISLVVTMAILVGVIPVSMVSAAPSGIVTAYVYYKINGEVPVNKRGQVSYNDTSQSNYGPSGNNTPMMGLKIDIDKLYAISQTPGSCVDYGESYGWPDWYFRPASGDAEDIQAYWDTLLQCMTPKSRAAFEATGMAENFTGYMLKRNTRDDNGYNVHLDGILNVSTESSTDVYVCELYDEQGVYTGGLVTDSTKTAVENPTFQQVLDIYEVHYGLASDTSWQLAGSTTATTQYTAADGNRFTVTVTQTESGSYKPHNTGDIGYSMTDEHYYLAKFAATKTADLFTVTYTDGMGGDSFSTQVHKGLYYGVKTPSFTGGTPMDPSGEKLFAGWSPTVAETVTEDVTYVARWTEKTYTVSWYDEDGTTLLERDEKVPNGTTPSFDGSIPTKPSDAQYRYEFVGWSPAVTPVNQADQTYTAVFRPVLQTYTVIWVDSDNRELERDEQVPYGELPTYDDQGGTTADLANAKTDDEYTYRFLGWNPAVSAVVGDITYTASYEKTKNTYKVTWLDDNGNKLEEDTVAYGEPAVYNGKEPGRDSTATHHYTFEGWLNEDGVDKTLYKTADTFPAVKKDVTYRAQYTATERLYAVTIGLKLDGNYVDSEQVHGAHIHPFISADGQTFYEGLDLCGTEAQTVGKFKVSAVPNGTYKIYVRDGDGYRLICDQIIVMDNADVEKNCNYYSVRYDGNGADSGVPAQAAYHFGAPVGVSAVPVRAGYVFKGWEVSESGTVLMPNGTNTVSLTGNITRSYTLTAKWVEEVDVKVNIHFDHTAPAGGYDVNAEKDDIQIELVWKPTDDSAPWLEVDDTLLYINAEDHEGFTYSTYPDGAAATDATKSVYTATEATFAGVEGGDRKFSLTFRKNNYIFDESYGDGTGITAVQDADGNWTLDLYLEYTTTNFALDFSVEMESDVPKQLYPDAVIARVLYWTGSDWEIISQQNSGKPGVNVVIDKQTGKGSGTYSVWQKDTAVTPEPYLYRIEVSAFVYGGMIVPYTETDLVAYTDGTYTATLDEIPNGKLGGSLMGAYYNGSEQVGVINAVIDVTHYKVTLDANGGLFGTNATKTYDELLVMPDISADIPTRTGGAYTFKGYSCYADKNNNGIYDAGDEPVAQVPAGEKLTQSYVLVAMWKNPIDILGDITIMGRYDIDGDGAFDTNINAEDHLTSVTVILQHDRYGTGQFLNMDSVTAPVPDYGVGENGAASYHFANLEDVGVWRVVVNNPFCTVLYQNEPECFTNPDAYNAQDNVAVTDTDDAAQVNIYIEFVPDTFDLKYEVIADAIGEDIRFRPTEAEVVIVYNGVRDTDGSTLEWVDISQLLTGGQKVVLSKDGTYYGTGTNPYVSYPVWKYHPIGLLYDYRIDVRTVKINGQSVSVDETAPFTVDYEGIARYLASGGFYSQSDLLKASIKPRSYDVKYYLEQGSDIELTVMKDGAVKIGSHTWSFTTMLQENGAWCDVPARPGMVFMGWVDENGKPVTEIDGAVQDITRLYATWATDNWADGDLSDTDSVLSDTRTGGDGIPDGQQICIEYSADNSGTVDTLFEIVTITGDAYTDITLGTQTNKVIGSTVSALGGYGFDGWRFGGSSDPLDNAENTASLTDTKMLPVIRNADGGRTYKYTAYFDVDRIKDADKTEDTTDTDATFGGDGIPDKYQAIVSFVSANTSHGSVSGNVFQTTTFADGATSGTVTPSLDGVVVTGAEFWAFDYWTKDNGAEKLSDEDVIRQLSGVQGNTTITFYAHFAIDEWNDTTEQNDKGDGIPDYKQVLVEYIASANGRGEVSGEDATQVFTLTDIDPLSGKYAGSVTPSKENLAVNPNQGFAFDHWVDLEGFWTEAGGKVSDDQPFKTHEAVYGGAIITYVAYFEADVWNGGDGTPDYKQILINYSSADTAMGAVAPESEVITLENPEGEDVSSGRISGAVATAESGFAFDYWYSNRNNIVYNDRQSTIAPYIQGAKGGEVYNLTAVFDKDIAGGGADGEDPDDIPDKYQKKLVFKVVNGSWQDGSTKDIVRYVTLEKDNEWHLEGTAAMPEIPTGMRAADGYKRGAWDVTDFPFTVSGTETLTYTYSFAPIAYVNYVYTEEHYTQKPDGSYALADTRDVTIRIELNAQEDDFEHTQSAVAIAPKDYGTHYTENTTHADRSASGTPMFQTELTLKLYYDLDTHTVSYDLNGGSANGTDYSTESYLCGNQHTVLGAPEKEGYSFLGWMTQDGKRMPADNITVNKDITLTAQWALRTDLSYSVNYLDEDTGNALSAPKVVDGVTTGTVINAASEVIGISGYYFTGADVESLTVGVDLTKNVINLYYAVDIAGGGADGEDPDDIPDKYQKKLVFKVVNGSWQDGSTKDIVRYVTLEKDNEWHLEGTAAMPEIPTGMRAADGYKRGAWDLTPPEVVSGTEEAVYTYTFDPVPVTPETGDAERIGLWFAVMLTSLGALLLLTLFTRKRNKQKV